MPKKYFIKGKEEITDTDAPVISDEFIDKVDGDEYRGQTIEVQSDTKLEDDLGTGDPIVMRAYEFATDPRLLQPNTQFPMAQEFFDSHMKGIAGMLWGDGLTPETEIEPRLIFSKDRRTYLITVWARPQLGQAVLETPKTLSEIANGKQNRDTIQRGVPVSSTKKKTPKRTT
jgi:hypothetical protein